MALKPIKGYEGMYLVSDDGDVYSLPRKVVCGEKVYVRSGRKLKPGRRGRDSIQYLFVILSDGKTSKQHAVHRLVAEAFVENKGNHDVVNHIDKNTLNNKAENLEWCDQQYNNEYGHNKRVGQYENGLKVAEFKSATYASKLTKISRTAICNALNGWSESAGGYEWRYEEGSDDLSHLQEKC